MRKLLIALAATGLIVGGAIAAHSAGDPTLDRPSWVRPNGTEIKGQVPKWAPVLGHQGQVIGFTRSNDASDTLKVFDTPGGKPIGVMDSSGFEASSR